MAEGPLERMVAGVLKVPPRPDPPAGSPSSLRVFNAAQGFYRYRVVQWVLTQLGTVIGLVASLLFLDRIIPGNPFMVETVIRLVETVGIAVFIIQLPMTFLMIGLDYRYRWYMVTDTSLRIREGLLRVREQTMTFANIQNLSIRQGPVQRLFGITDLRVRTAGGGEKAGSSDGDGSESNNMHLGYLRGVDNAAEIRDVILARMRGQRDAGLGDPDDVAGATTGGGETLDAARELLEETRRLRAVLG